MTNLLDAMGGARATSLLIGGELLAGEGEAFDVHDPATEATLASPRAASLRQVEQAVASARAAFHGGTWGDAEKRSRCITRLADLIEQNSEELLALIVAEVGTPITTARSLQVPGATAHLRHAAQAALRDRDVDLGRHELPVPSRSQIFYRPVGVVAAISAYNYPLLTACAKLGGAWAAGCTTVLLPSSLTPLGVLRFAELVLEAGFPPGVFNLVLGGPEVGEALTGHPGLDKVTFTGSVRTGRSVMRQAAANVTGVTLELGGKSAAILLPGEDYAPVVEPIHARYLRNAGQGCQSPTRILVERARLDEFLTLSSAYFRTVKVGDPWDADTLVGPLITAVHRDWVERFVADAVDRGARIVAGGGRPDQARGHFMNPILIAGVTNSDPIVREELFAPVGIVLPYDDIEQAVAIANDSDLGLAASLFGDAAQCAQIAPRLRVGTVSINNGGGLRADAPLCGFGDSGIGSEGGEDGVREFLKTQHVQVAL
ncbi:MAG: aldehyde dehydrogenase [Sphingomonadales bacterium]|jgi:aldehyde dehydrogenase (NAD+)/betaine-aldehyde dehydrogenase|nr:aldehyde dehydrogenase [Sphingomonadales bacterium]